MSFFSNFFARNSSAPVARDRLQILLSHEHSNNDLPSDLLAKLNHEILEVIKKHISIDQEKIQESLFFPRVGYWSFCGSFF
ncbi:Cell division topological specificity factor [Entomobacter blattae]|uniref:Cell division topological specificity factor n=1 Tax=Entomobacter blattae TaxID=2762277 RepID=A0A7H1NQX7_9PROT|nr:Cell division topological specificity factor [Entomobacter blattae]